MFRALIAHAVTLELFHSRSTGSIPQLLLSGFSCEQSLQQAMKGRAHGPHLPSSAHLESTLAPGGVGDSKEAGCDLSAYPGAELQLRTPHRHHKQVTQCCHFRTMSLPLSLRHSWDCQVVMQLFHVSHSTQQSRPVALSHTKWCLSNTSQELPHSSQDCFIPAT